jgi:hypothetical protein
MTVTISNGRIIDEEFSRNVIDCLKSILGMFLRQCIHLPLQGDERLHMWMTYCPETDELRISWKINRSFEEHSVHKIKLSRDKRIEEHSNLHKNLPISINMYTTLVWKELEKHAIKTVYEQIEEFCCDSSYIYETCRHRQDIVAYYDRVEIHANIRKKEENKVQPEVNTDQDEGTPKRKGCALM